MWEAQPRESMLTTVLSLKQTGPGIAAWPQFDMNDFKAYEVLNQDLLPSAKTGDVLSIEIRARAKQLPHRVSVTWKSSRWPHRRQQRSVDTSAWSVRKTPEGHGTGDGIGSGQAIGG